MIEVNAGKRVGSIHLNPRHIVFVQDDGAVVTIRLSDGGNVYAHETTAKKVADAITKMGF